MESSDLRFFSPDAETLQTRNHLPHWQQEGAVYFVTFRLADAVPHSLLASWTTERDAWLAHHPEPWTTAVEEEYHRRFTSSMERWLDAGHGACVLRDRACRDKAAEALAFFEEERCRQLAWVLMPNHIHALFVLNPAWPLEKMIHSWKRHSAREINKALGRRGALWQKDYFDRLVRDTGHLANCVRYVRRNPLKAKLRPGEYELWESELAKGMIDEGT